MLTYYSPKNTTRAQSEDLVTIEEELRTGERCAILGFADSLAYPESHGSGGARRNGEPYGRCD
jgi:hypothetical protein